LDYFCIISLLYYTHIRNNVLVTGEKKIKHRKDKILYGL
jgi:hypothetical protein